MPLNHLGTVAQNHQRSNCAQAPGLQVNCGAVVDLAVDHRVDQAHNVRCQFNHGRRGLRVVVRTVVTHPKLHSSLFKVHYLFIVIITLEVYVVFQIRLVGAQVRVVIIEI